jgi:hypothetical protein
LVLLVVFQVFEDMKVTYSAAREESSEGSSILSKSGGHEGGSSEGDNGGRLHLEEYVYGYMGIMEERKT